jgi:hypothetical protein
MAADWWDSSPRVDKPEDWWASSPLVDAKPVAKPADEPGMLMSAAAGLGKGFGSTMLGGQRLVGKGINAVGDLLTPDQTTLSSLVTGEKRRGAIQAAGDWLVRDAEEGRAKLAGQFAPYKEANPISAGAGEFAGEIAPTLPLGGAIAAPVRAAGAGNLANAIASSGMRGGNLLTRSAGGAIAGGAGAALVEGDPSAAGPGAAVGAAMPGAMKVVGYAGNTVGSLLRPFFGRGQDKAVTDILVQHADDPVAALAALQRATQVVPGSAPMTAAAAGDAGLAGLTRAVQNQPGMAGEISNRLAQQNAARTAALEGIAGNPGKVAVAEEARKALTDPMRESVLSRARGIDGGAMAAQIDDMLAQPGNAGKLAQSVLADFRSQIAKHTKGGEINARALYALRKDINDILGGKLQGEAGNARHASSQLIAVKGMIDDAIEAASARPMSTSRAVGFPGPNISTNTVPGSTTPAATGWRDYLSTYSNASKPIDRMNTLQDLLKGVQTGTPDIGGNLVISPAKLNTILKNSGDDLAKILTPEELQVVRNVAGDANASLLGMSAGKAVGSNTMQNALAQDQLLRSALGKFGMSTPVRATLGNLLSIPYATANRQISARLREVLLDPSVAARLMSAQHVPLSDMVNPALAYRAAPVLTASGQ